MPRSSRKPEQRAVPLRNVEVRAAGDGDETTTRTIAGYAAVYNSQSDDLGGFREIIAPGAFRDVLAGNPDVRMPFVDHVGLPVGRTIADTLRLSEDEHGLHFEVDLPDTERGRELAVAVERGDVSECSFRFVVEPEGREWVYPDGDDLPLRTINVVSELWDVCLVTYPAYSATSAGLRSLEGSADVEIPPNPADDTDLRRRRLALRDRDAA